MSDMNGTNCNALVVYESTAATSVASIDMLENNYKSKNPVTYNAYHKPSGYVGLSNQGATCYMNSLLQSLYMTPEFRRALYSWSYNKEKDGPEEHSIPLQLQRLFAGRHGICTRCKYTFNCTCKRLYMTRPLRHYPQVFQQQDIQELCRVLFDALEEAFKGSELENVIDEIYAGQLVDYVKCLDVDYSSERVDKVQDFSLAIRPFGSSVPVKSLAEAIELFLKPEVLDGDNQYFAESVGRKVDAIKGLKLGKTPHVLTFQLKRFVYDFSSGDVVQRKLNDAVSFPMFIDMNKYVSKKPLGSTSGKVNAATEALTGNFDSFLSSQIAKLRRDRSEGMLASDVSPVSTVDTPERASPLDGIDAPPLRSVVTVPGELSFVCEDKETWELKVEAGKDSQLDAQTGEGKELLTYEDAQAAAANGEWVYELFAVLIHSGAIYGGHYYAYIKDLDSGKWLDFNDATVTEIAEAKVKDSWGGVVQPAYSSVNNSSYYSSSRSAASPYQSSASAYMLQYRKVPVPTAGGGKRGCVTFPPNDLVPQYIVEAVQAAEEERVRKEQAEEDRRNQLSVKVAWRGRDHIIKANKKSLFVDFMFTVCRQLGLTGALLAEPLTDFATEETSWDACPELSDEECEALVSRHLRLRLRDYYTKNLQEPYELQACGEKTLDFCNFWDNKSYLLEAKQAEEPWEQYNKDDIDVTCHECNETATGFKPARLVRVDKCISVAEMKRNLARSVNCLPEEILMVKLTVKPGIQEPIIIEEMLAGKLLKDYTGPTLCNWAVYFERRSLGATDVQDSRCKKAKLSETNRLTVSVVSTSLQVDPAFKGRGLLPRYELVVTKAMSVGEFRKLVREKLELSEDEPFRMIKQYSTGVEMTDSQKFIDMNLYHNTLDVYLVPGEPVQPGCTSLTLFMLKDAADQKEVCASETAVGFVGPPLPPPVESGAKSSLISFAKQKVSLVIDESRLQFIQNFQVNIPICNASSTLGNIKKDVYDMLVQKNHISADVSIDRVRLRQKTYDNKVGKVYRDDKSFSSCEKDILIQILGHAEEGSTEEKVLFVQKWDRATWTLGVRKEAVVRLSDPTNEAAAALAELMSIPNPKDMRVMYMNFYANVHLCDLKDNAHNKWIDVSENKSAVSTTFNHQLDGHLLLVQDVSEPLKTFSDEEWAIIEKNKAPTVNYSVNYYSDYNKPYSYGAKRPVEQGIKIKTQKARELDKQKNEEEERKNDNTSSSEGAKEQREYAAATTKESDTTGGMALFSRDDNDDTC